MASIMRERLPLSQVKSLSPQGSNLPRLALKTRSVVRNERSFCSDGLAIASSRPK